MRLIDPKAGYDLVAKDYRKEYAHLDSFDWDACNRLLAQALASLQERAPLEILDAGCGDGRALNRLIRRCRQGGIAARFTGWDISAGMLRQAAKRLEEPATLIERDVAEAPETGTAPAGGFHLVTAFFLLVHLDDPGAFFGHLATVMQPGGFLICNTIPQKEGYAYGEGRNALMIEYVDHASDAIREALELAGWDCLEAVEGPWSTVFLARWPV